MCGGTYPRSIPACAGEPRAAIATTSPAWGLSPRVRGNPCVRSLFLILLRSIPACAGEPRCPGESVWRQTVYPRVCGGTTVTLTESVFSAGLSPRVRGNPIMIITAVAFIGSIPACAGEPLDESDEDDPYRVYPRVCGGTVRNAAGNTVSAGLSPRVRGNQFALFLCPFLLRSIPACAGEPGPRRRSANLRKVYPRVCGGTAVGGSFLTSSLRSIPACAGEPFISCVPDQSGWVYPRVCGGTWRRRRISFLVSGLSPRVRGNHLAP